MPTTTVPTLLNTELAAAKLLQAAGGYVATLGSIPDNAVWTAVAADLKNANTFLFERAAIASDLTIKASSVFYTASPVAYSALTLALDKTISSVLVPGGARTSGGNYFYSEAAPFGETLFLLAGYFNHIYFVSDSPVKFGVIATPTITAPDAFFTPFITSAAGQSPTTNPRQAVCYVDATGALVSLVSFPRMVNGVASIGPTSGPSFVDWRTNPAALSPNNAVQAQFLFPGGTATGEVGEAGVFLGPDLIAYQKISPQVLKDADVDMTVVWNAAVGEPTSFLP